MTETEIEKLKAENQALRALAQYGRSYVLYHLEKFYDGDPERMTAGAWKYLDECARLIGSEPDPTLPEIQYSDAQIGAMRRRMGFGQ